MRAISFRFVLGAMLVVGMVGCGKQKPGVVPVTSPIQKFEPPDADDVFPEGEDEPAAADGSFETDEE